MKHVHFSTRGLLYLAVLAVLAVLAAILSVLGAVDQGSGLVSRVWPFLNFGFLFIASALIYQRMWRARGNPDEIKKIEAQSLYGVLPPKVRNWLFP
jgi:hypothetical protein